MAYEMFLTKTYKILEATDPTEYLSLDPGNLALYNLIVSAGFIDLGEDTIVKAVLFGMFGEGTTTRDNLENLLKEDPVQPEPE